MDSPYEVHCPLCRNSCSRQSTDCMKIPTPPHRQHVSCGSHNYNDKRSRTSTCCHLYFCPPSPMMMMMQQQPSTCNDNSVTAAAQSEDHLVPFWLDVYFIAPPYLDSKLYWNMFQLTDLERYDVQLKTLFRKKWKDIVLKYENYRTVLNHEMNCRLRAMIK